MRKIEIISECGINHNGDMVKAVEMIMLSAEAGADIAKFQTFDAEELIRKVPTLPDYNKEWVRKTEFSKDDLFYLAEKCEELGIEFMSSVFDKRSLEWLEEVGVRRYKIASPLATDINLCKKVVDTGKEIIVSSGHLWDHTYKEHIFCPWWFARACPHVGDQWDPCTCRKIKFLYCVSKYPTALEELELPTAFGDETKSGYWGFSDHTEGVTASIVAMARGARMIEKHFTLDRDMDGPDHFMSIELVELQELCDFRDEIELIGAKYE